jgi:hypothetical protein
MKKALLVCLSFVLILSCKLMNKDEEKKPEVSLPYTKFSVAEDGYGVVDGEKITQYTLTNPSGMIVKIIN